MIPSLVASSLQSNNMIGTLYERIAISLRNVVLTNSVGIRNLNTVLLKGKIVIFRSL